MNSLPKEIDCPNAVGVALHTALRKLCNHPRSAEAHSAIQKLSMDLWLRYLDEVWANLKTQPVVDAVKTATHVLREDARPEAIRLVECLDAFDDAGWNSYVAYLQGS